MKISQLKSFFFMLLLAAAAPLFAQEIMPPGMNSLMSNILAVFTSDFVKGIFIVAFICAGIAYAYNKDNETMKKKIIAVGVGIAILGSAQWIVGKFFEASSR